MNADEWSASTIVEQRKNFVMTTPRIRPAADRAPMRVDIVHPDEIDATQATLWNRFREGSPLLANPLFGLDFVRLASRARPNTRVGIMEQDGKVIGFLPFEPTGGRRGQPIAGPISDLQGAIAASDASWDAAALIKGCGLDLFDFDRIPCEQTAFGLHQTQVLDFAQLRLPDGYEGFVRERKEAKSAIIAQNRRYRRRLEREFGELRFEVADANPDSLAAMMRWKRAQLRATGCLDIFQYGWIVRLLEELHRTATPELTGLLSTLYAGDTPVAYGFGAKSAKVYHGWFLPYNPALAKHSPGLIMILEIIKSADTLGFETLEFGNAVYRYKARFTNHTYKVANGSIVLPSVAMLERLAWRGVQLASDLWYDCTKPLPMWRVTRWPRHRLQEIEAHRRFA